MQDHLLTILKEHWGATSFRSGQREVITAILERRDALAVFPTGGGKSLLYQLPSVLLDGLTLVVSPLIALMEDQVSALKERGIRAASITSSMSVREVDQTWTNAEFGMYNLLYVTPERLQSQMFRERASRLGIKLVAVDEAHCISEWGHDFRPAYRSISEIRPLLEQDSGGAHIPFLAVTATATPEVRGDIIDQLALKDPLILIKGFDRPNIVWSVFQGEDKRKKLLEIVESVPGSGLVYAGTRRACEQWAKQLREDGVAAEAYHAGMDARGRSEVQQRWLEGTTRYIVATSAFGMGIDKPDVRVVVHLVPPPTLEAYYQEAGRAGRDGGRSYAVMLLNPGDDDLPRSFAKEGHPDPATIQNVYSTVCSLAQIAVGSKPDGWVHVDLEAVSSVLGESARTIKAAINRLEAEGIWTVQTPPSNRVGARVSNFDGLRRATNAEESSSLARFLDAFQRHLPAEANGSWVEVDISKLGENLSLTSERVLDGLRYLVQRQLLEVRLFDSEMQLEFAEARSDKIVLDVETLKRTRRKAIAQVDDVIRYAQCLTCRRQFLLTYFGESAPAQCGQCDICLGRHRPEIITPDDEKLLRKLLGHINSGDPRKVWLSDSNIPNHRRDALGDWLVNEGYVQVLDPLTDALAVTDKAKRFIAPVDSRHK